MQKALISIVAALAATMLLASNALAQTAKPKATPTPNPFQYGGYIRAYYFTRQNATGAPQTFKAINQASFNTAISLHAQYTFEGSPFTVGGTYLYANPLNGCTTPVSHLSQPCGKQTFTGQNPVPTNPDDTLPGFILSTFYEAYVQYRDPVFYAKIGNQVINTPWANPSDSRLKPVAFQGGDFTAKLNKQWTIEGAYMDRFESRASSAFDNATMLTSHPVDGPGVAANIFTPGGGSITTSGFAYGRLGLVQGAFTANLHYYGFLDIANAFWVDGKYSWSKSYSKPFLAVQLGNEQNAGRSVIGKINSTIYGVQAGISPWKNVDFTVGYNSIPQQADTITLPAGVSCGANDQIKVSAGVTFPYFLPSGGTTNCLNNAGGTTTVYYGGWASPYTDSYATDVLFTTSISQGLIDRRSPGSGVKLALTLQTADHRGRFIASQAFYQYGNNTSGTSATQETDLDGTWFFRKPGSGPYHGLLIRHRYAERDQKNTPIFGGAPDFKYNRTQLEFDF